MPHADSAYVPSGLTKPEFWDHVHDQLAPLLEGQRNWVTNLANASSLIYSSLLAYAPHFGDGERAVNWCGFYVESSLFPAPRYFKRDLTQGRHNPPTELLLAPFCGKPACQVINVAPGKARGVCANAFIDAQTKLVPDVDAYPGHIACDGQTKSEVVCPLILQQEQTAVVGVLDLDCLAVGGFDADDAAGLQKIADLIVNACDW
ncbi:hypothetical protein QCA50_003844 [Cerrena zonata]|uniref:GAF domain-like protein n=1 Tax=Cerrena zonata TaxID=2478898 RepID=A0AAW0GFV9_9APHY